MRSWKGSEATGRHFALRRGRLIAGFVVLFAIVSCGGAGSTNAGNSPAAQQHYSLRIAFTPGFASLPVHAAVVNGYFKKNGLDVTVTEGLDLPTYISSLDRQFDIVMTTATIFLSAVSQGVPAQAVSNLQQAAPNPPTDPLMTKNPAIQSVKDLPGKTIGAPTLTGVSAASLQYIMKKDGLNPDSVKLVMVPFATQADQLNAGRIDGALSTPPYYTPLLNAGYRNVVDTPAEAVKLATGDSKAVATNAFFVATQSFVKSKPGAYKAFRKSIQEGADWMKGNLPAARTMLQQWLQVTAEVANTSPVPVVTASITASDIEPWITIMKSVGTLKGTIPSAKQLVAP